MFFILTSLLAACGPSQGGGSADGGVLSDAGEAGVDAEVEDSDLRDSDLRDSDLGDSDPDGLRCTEDCDDENPCTEDRCDNERGSCVHELSPLCEGMVAWWRLDEGADLRVRDSAGENHCQLIPEATGDSPVWRVAPDSVAGASLRFDGVDDAALCGAHPPISPPGDISVSLWFAADSWREGERLLGNGVYEIFHRGGWAGDRLYFLVRNDSQAPLGQSSWDYRAGVRTAWELPLGSWHHLVSIKRGQDLEIWIDGVRAGLADECLEGATVRGDPTSEHLLGRGANDDGASFAGGLDDVRIYDRALSAEEICQLCQQLGAPAGVACCQPRCEYHEEACAETACSDGVDNDEDGLVDEGDPGCRDGADDTETLEVADRIETPIEELAEHLDAHFSETYPEGIIDTFPYNLSYGVAGLTAMYEATQDVHFIDLAVDTVDAVFYDENKRRDIDGDGVPEWIIEPCLEDHDGDPSTPERVCCLYTQHSAKHFIRLARVILHDEDLNDIYGDWASDLVEQIRTSIVNDLYCLERFLPGYSDVHHIVAHPVGVLLELYLLEGDIQYIEHEGAPHATTLATLTEQANLLHDTLFDQVDDPRAVAWGATGCRELVDIYPECYLVNADHTEPGECFVDGVRHCVASDVSHASEFVFTAIELYRAGIVFTLEDVQRLAYTFKRHVWNGDQAFPCWRDFVDGHNEPPGGRYGPWGMGRHYTVGWVLLAGFDPELRQLLELTAATPRRNNQGFERLSFWGQLARSAVAGDCRYTNGAREILDGVDNDCDGVVDE